MEHSVYIVGGSTFVFALSLFYAFTNGFRNAPLIVATVVSTRAISPGRAFLLCAVCEFLGAVFLGSAVVATISQKMFGDVFQQASGHDVVLVLASAMTSAILWGSFAYWHALPTSNNHALFAGFMGASWSVWGSTHLFNATLLKVFMVLILSPVAVLFLSWGVTVVARWMGAWMTPRIVPFADQLHILGSMLVAGADGSNDGQMAMSVALLSWGFLGVAPIIGASSVLAVPLWLKMTVASCMGLGVLMGGRRIIRKFGMSFYRIEIVQGVGAQLTSALTILSCVARGFPASTTQVITGSILGAGVAKNPRGVRWSLVIDVVISWFVTFPVVALLSILFAKFFTKLMRP